MTDRSHPESRRFVTAPKPSWLVLILLLCLARSDVVSADSLGQGAAWLKKDFASAGQNNVIGTEMTTELKRFYVDPVSDAKESDWLTIRQDVELANHSLGVISGGFYNLTRTSYRGSMFISFLSYMRAELGPGVLYTQNGSSRSFSVRNDVSRDRRLIWTALRMSYPEACRSTNPTQYPNCTFPATWEMAYDRNNPYIKIILTLPSSSFAGLRPLRILTARHGYYTKSAWRENDIHVEMADHKYYVRPSCQDTCSQLWSAYWPSTGPYILPWQSPSLESPQVPEVMIWPVTSGGVGSLVHGICSGLAPETPCGCIQCTAPAFVPNERVYPDTTDGYDKWPIIWPFDWVVKSSTFPPGQSALWTEQARAATQEWDAALGFEMFRRYPGGSSQEIEIRGWTTLWPDPDAVAKTERASSQLKNYESCQSGQSGNGQQYRNRLAPPGHPVNVVWIDLYDYDWTETMQYTSPSLNSPRGLIPMRSAIAHEFGHIAGLDHGYGGSIWPNNAMGLIQLYGYNNQTVSIDYANNLVKAVNCLVYRGKQ